jgi:hypothetical protein
MWQTCALLIAIATAQPPTRFERQPAEPPRAHQCRTAAAPAAQACLARCEAAFATRAERTERFECQTACTRRALHAAADCRRAPDAAPAAAAAALAAR